MNIHLKKKRKKWALVQEWKLFDLANSLLWYGTIWLGFKGNKTNPFSIALTPFKVVNENGFYRLGKYNYSFYWTVRVTLLAKEEQEMENLNNFPSFLFPRPNGSWNETKGKLMKLCKFHIKVLRLFNITFAVSSQSLIASPEPLKIITPFTNHHVFPAP